MKDINGDSKEACSDREGYFTLTTKFASSTKTTLPVVRYVRLRSYGPESKCEGFDTRYSGTPEL